jgi:hypothetical protein
MRPLDAYDALLSVVQQLFCCKSSKKGSVAAVYNDYVDYILFDTAYVVLAFAITGSCKRLCTSIYALAASAA